LDLLYIVLSDTTNIHSYYRYVLYFSYELAESGTTSEMAKVEKATCKDSIGASRGSYRPMIVKVCDHAQKFIVSFRFEH